jgi:hypothetical protein
MGDGRRAAIWWAVLAAVVIAGDHLLALAMQQVIVRSQFRYSRLYRGGNDADVIVIGDSRGVHSFYAPALEQMTGLRVLNLSYNSLSPHVAEAVLLDYLDHNRAPKIVVIEATSTITRGEVAGQLRAYAGFSRRMAALFAGDHPAEARLSRVLWLYPLNSEFFMEALHYMRRSDQDWIFHDTMPDALRQATVESEIHPVPAEIDALARIVRALEQRGIEVRLVIAPYAPIRRTTNAAAFVRLIESRTGTRVWNYIDALEDLDGFADTVHLNERGSRAFMAMLVRDGAFGMARSPARL